MDLSDKGSECAEISGRSLTPDRVSSDGGSNSTLKTCVDCGTSKTPLWRSGPAGPKSLCNACGIRSRKKKRALMGAPKEGKKSKSSSSWIVKSSHSSSSSGESSSEKKKKKKGSWDLGRELGSQRPRSSTKRRRKQLGEEEQAAFLLMALSCGSVYA